MTNSRSGIPFINIVQKDVSSCRLTVGPDRTELKIIPGTSIAEKSRLITVSEKLVPLVRAQMTKHDLPTMRGKFSPNYPDIISLVGGDGNPYRLSFRITPSEKMIGDYDVKFLKATGLPTRPVVYIAAPYTDSDPEVVNFRVQEFVKFAAKIEQGGIFHAVSALFNVLLLDRGQKLPGSWAFWKSYSITFVALADSLIVLTLPGWETSDGVQGEIAHAKKLGKPIAYINPLEEKGN